MPSKKDLERMYLGETRRRVEMQTHATLLEQALAAERARTVAPAAPPAAPPLAPPPPTPYEIYRRMKQRSPYEAASYMLEHAHEIAAEAERRRATGGQ